ncbi:MAG: histidinol-phosphate transaminase [Actinobacteria bacterium]|nr:histidinol-phosphate transaminase [Actinomycetota bacterium]
MEHYFKKSVIELSGYHSPPQGKVRAKLNQNESPFDVPMQIKRGLVDAAAKLSWNRYPVNESPVLKEKLAALYHVSAEQILLGNGSNQLFQTLLTAIIGAEDSVIYCPPSFSLFDLYVPVFDGKLVPVFNPPGSDFPGEEILEKIADVNPKLILLCSPNNPTGSEIPLSILEKICNISTGLVFWDEAYGEFCEESAIPLLKKYQNLIVSRTFSKAYSIAGLRFGYLIARSQIISQFRKVNLPYNINLFTELVAATMLDNVALMDEHVWFLKEERDRLYAEMIKMPAITVYPSSANFLLFRSPNGQKIFSELKERGVLVRDVGGYPLLENHLRVNVGTREENDIFLQALRESMAVAD